MWGDDPVKSDGGGMMKQSRKSLQKCKIPKRASITFANGTKIVGIPSPGKMKIKSYHPDALVYIP
jgi:hypothetical protein